MKKLSIILSLAILFGLFGAESFAYTRQENIVSEFNDFEGGVDDWTNGLISGCAGGGDVTESTTVLSVVSDTGTSHGKYLEVVNSGTLSATATFMFDIDSARKTAASAQSTAKVKAGSYFGLEFDFRLPNDASSSTALELMLWDTRASRNRYAIVKIVPSSGKLTAGSKSYTLSKDTWYKMKLEAVVGSALQRLVIMDDSGDELFVSNINDGSKYLPVLLYGFITFSQGGADCEFHLDNTKAYTFAAEDLNTGKTLYSDSEIRTLDSVISSFEAEAQNKVAGFDGTELPSPAFAVKTKVMVADASKVGEIKISLSQDSGTKLLTAVSPGSKTVKIGNGSSVAGGLDIESGIWYEIELICNAESDYQRVEITNSASGETQVFDGTMGYSQEDISAFGKVLVECTFSEDTTADFEGINVYTASKSHASPFYSMESNEIEADVSEITVSTSAPLTGFSADKVTFETDDGKTVPAEILYDGSNTVTIVPEKPFKENARMKLTFSREILVGGEMPKFDSVLSIKVLIKNFYMDFVLTADGEPVVQASDIAGKSNISCDITTTSRTSEDFSGIYVMSLMDKNGEVKALAADNVSVSSGVPSCVSALSMPVPGNGGDMEIYIMLIDNFQSSKAVVKYIKID